MRRALLIVEIAVITLGAQAPAHYCDSVQPTSETMTTGAHQLQVCAAAGAEPVRWTLYIDGVSLGPISLTTDGTISVSGQKAYTGTVQVVPGTHVYQMAIVTTAGESVLSSAFTVTATIDAGMRWCLRS